MPKHFDETHNADLQKRMAHILPVEQVKQLREHSEKPATSSEAASALSPTGLALPDLGATLRWIDVEKCDDNPFQTREIYDPEELENLKESLNRTGQLHAAIARPHPDKIKAEAGWVQLAFGHRRRRAVSSGANAGSNLTDNKRFRGKLLVMVKPLSDLEMGVFVTEENEASQKPSAIERARGFLKLKELLAQTGEGGKTWRAYAEGKGITYVRLRQILRLLELKKEWQTKIERGQWNEKHGRALLDLKDAPQLQERLAKAIDGEKLSGSRAVERAEELRRLRPPASDIKLLDVADSAMKAGDQQRAKDARETAQEKVATGNTGLTVMRGGAANSSTSEAANLEAARAFESEATRHANPAHDAQTLAEAASHFQNAKAPLAQIGIELFLDMIVAVRVLENDTTWVPTEEMKTALLELSTSARNLHDKIVERESVESEKSAR